MNIRDLKEGDFVDVVKPYSDRRVSFEVLSNNVDNFLILHNENNGRTIHLFYRYSHCVKLIYHQESF